MVRPALIACFALLAASPTWAQDAACNRVALDLFDASRRSRTALDDMQRVAQLYDDAMALYDEEMPSDPGFLGAAFVIDNSDLGEIPVCAADGTAQLTLTRLRRAGLARWDDEEGEYGLRVMYVVSDHDLLDVIYTETTGDDGTAQTEVTARGALTSSQSYLGARVITPHVDVTVGVIEVGGVAQVEEELGLAGARETPDEPLRVHLHVAFPSFGGVNGGVVFGRDFDSLETALLDLQLPLPYETTGRFELAWLGDESRAVLRAGVTDPWDILTADLGVETSTAFFRHGRVSARYVSPIFNPVDLDELKALGAAKRFFAPYLRLGAEAELSRFSGRHFEDVTGASGATGYALYGVLMAHMLLIPIRMELRVGGGRNRVDLLEHAASFADRDEFVTHAVVSIGW